MRNKLYPFRCVKQRFICIYLLSIILFTLSFKLNAQQGFLVSTDQTQKDFLKAYKLAFDLSDNDYRGISSTMDTILFRKFGEHSIYWVCSGSNQGSFIIPDTLPSRFSSATAVSYANYNWKNFEHKAIQFKITPKKIAVFRSKLETEGYSISWEAQYFNNMFETFLYKNIYYFVNEDDLTNDKLSDSTELLIIPAFNVHAKGETYYIDSVFKVYPNIKTGLDHFLSRGGTLYTEGNAAYLAQKAAYLSANAVNFDDKAMASSNLVTLQGFSASNPIAFAHTGVKNKLYCSYIPKVNTGSAEIIASAGTDRPAIFVIKVNGGRIVCNLGLPTVGGIAEIEGGSRQLQWTLNTLLYAFSRNIDVTRGIYNQLPATVIHGYNSVSYDRIDTFEVHMIVRNLSSETISDINVQENLRNYFKLLDVTTSGVTSYYANGILTLSGISIPPHSETTIVYRVTTPTPDSEIHETVDKLLDYGNFMAASLNTTSYKDTDGNHSFNKKRDYADIMFSARLFGDADINWKNFLGLDWQPFKVFMIMENKERTQAENTVYTQYIPKDMPFYRSDGKLDIPIIKTPGGTYIDILKGSEDKNHPEFDMDGDGHPDVWLDTASIYPKGYKIKDTLVYWANPWKTLEAKRTIYEDIDHDGQITTDTNEDGIFETEDTGDKIRAWKITWPIGTVKGNDYFDPYCSMEVWVDPPDMVALAKGVAYAYGTNTNKEGFYPYKTLDDAKTQKSTNDCWVHWMDKNTDNSVKWVDMYHQKMYNYQGYAFMDPATYVPMPWDSLYAYVPKPHEEFIGIISMGGEEIDMTHPTPSQSLYSKIDYKTIFNEKRTTPIRTTYSFYAPLPNPMQFEYLASNYSITDTTGKALSVLPAKGKAHLQFDLDASTEYSYYWIRNAGHKVERTPLWIKDADPSLGSGVFGYMIYEIPKGMGGYKITLPKKNDGTYDTDSIVKVEGKPFEKWLTNVNTEDSVKIWEDPFAYQVYIPQLLIPPSLCDKNGDGVDDWIDDKGDRYQSETGFLHDPFMADNGEDHLAGTPHVFSHVDDGITINKGWSAGGDDTYGSDKFDQLGKAHFTIHALYEGKGKEGPVDISKGGTLVVEEIFGGSPWVIFSHVLTANAEGVDYKITSSASPSSVKYGIDTVFIKHTIEDQNEPHEFNANYDPYRASFGTSTATVTSMAGGKDPCGMIAPDTATSTIIDPKKDHRTITLIPAAASINKPEVIGYPKSVSGTFLEVKIEVMNGSAYDWLNTTITPVLTGLGNTKAELTYISYPRPLVPDDQPATLSTGWRFNQPEGEVLINLGNTFISKLQSTRRLYFVFLFSIDETLKKGIYEIKFNLSGQQKNYKGQSGENLSLSVAPVKFSIVEKNSDGKPKEFQKMKFGVGALNTLKVNGSEYFQGLNQVRWSNQDINYTNFNNLPRTLPASFDKSTGIETIDLSKVSRLPNADTLQLSLLEKVVVNSYRAGETIDLTNGENLSYTYNLEQKSIPGNKVSVSPYGPKILISQKLYSVNGVKVEDGITIPSDKDLYIVTQLQAINVGSDASNNTLVKIHPGTFYTVLTDSLKPGVTFSDGLVSANLGFLAPGESKSAYVYYTLNQSIANKDELMTVLKLSDITYEGTSVSKKFGYADTSKVLFSLYDFQLQSIDYQRTSESTCHITVKAVNRGLSAQNIWLRIYPVVGGSIGELPIAQTEISTFNTNQVVELQLDYVLPSNENIEVYAKIDDGENVAEVIEKNNYKIQQLLGPMGTKDLKKEFGVSVSPNPFTEKVKFSYQLTEGTSAVKITIYAQSGSELIDLTNCPVGEGTHDIEWTPSNLLYGNYIYKMTITERSGHSKQITGVLIKTDR
jgi:hypothetical protein